jgi:murein L,D-transpeptidase YcbB/YkuD
MMSLLTSLRHAAAGALLLAGCAGQAADDTSDTASAVSSSQPVQPLDTAAPVPATPKSADARIEVNLESRKLTFTRAGSIVATHDVAVGSTEWPTQEGEWTVTQVVFNPEWIPPENESWAKDEKRKEPGAADNPLGRVQLVYDPPRSIHGTNEPTSIGKAVSHGSIRVANEVGLQLARQVMEAAGVPNGEEQMTKAANDRSTKIVIDLPAPVPIRVF